MDSHGKVVNVGFLSVELLSVLGYKHGEMSGGVNRALSVKIREKLSCASLKIQASHIRIKRSKSVSTLATQEDGIFMTRFERRKPPSVFRQHDSQHSREVFNVFIT